VIKLNLPVPHVYNSSRNSALPPLWTPLRRRLWSSANADCGPEETHPHVAHNLRWFRLDGVFAQASESVTLTYLPLFVLALGASRAQIGTMSALSSLSAALVLFPGATLVENWGRRKAICLLGGGGAARVVLLTLALLPLAFSGSFAICVVFVLVVFRSAFANLSLPAWMSLTADVVPLSCRGRYFASRNIAMGVAGMVTVFFVGQLITHVGAPSGYQLALGTAFVIGLTSTLSFTRIKEPPLPAIRTKTQNTRRLPRVRNLRNHPEFLAFCASGALWNLSLGVAAPFFNVYLVEELGATANSVGGLTVIHTLAALPSQRLFGVLVDRWGPRSVQVVTGLFIPLIPWGWAFIRSPLQLVPIEVISGLLWAGYGLANFNLLLVLTPEDRRPRYTALYQIVVMIAFACGSAVGGIIAAYWGYSSVFILTGVGRLGAALLFVRLVQLPDPSAPTEIKQKRRPNRLGFLKRRRKVRAH
jgi:MFS family permease